MDNNNSKQIDLLILAEAALEASKVATIARAEAITADKLSVEASALYYAAVTASCQCEPQNEEDSTTVKTGKIT